MDWTDNITTITIIKNVHVCVEVTVIDKNIINYWTYILQNHTLGWSLDTWATYIYHHRHRHTQRRY
jgi:hypothetical protein